jgi:hypothetical protein
LNKEVEMKKKKDISRREFIKKVGLTAAAVGVSSSIPKLLKPARAAVRDHILLPAFPGHRTRVCIHHRVPGIDKGDFDINKDGYLH